jgi:hypothetical protein
MEPLDRFQPQSIFPEQVDTANNIIVPHYFQAAVFHDEDGGINVGMVNTSRFNFKGGGKDLYEHIESAYGTVHFLTLQEFANQP